MGWCAAIGAEAKRRLGRAAEAKADLAGVLAECERSGFRWGSAVAERLLAAVSMDLGERADSVPRLRRALRISLEVENLLGCAEALEGYAQVEDDPAHSTAALSTADRIRDELATPGPRPIVADVKTRITELRSSFGGRRFETAWVAARSRPPEEIIRETIERLP